jgi:hypothetical protein
MKLIDRLDIVAIQIPQEHAVVASVKFEANFESDLMHHKFRYAP